MARGGRGPRPPILLLFDELDRLDHGLPPSGAFEPAWQRLVEDGIDPLAFKHDVLAGQPGRGVLPDRPELA